MKASCTRFGGWRAVCLALILGGVQFLPPSSLGAHPDLWVPSIPYPAAGNDTLALAHREWVINGSSNRPDVLGPAGRPEAGEVAFRFLSDISAFEAVLAAPDERDVVRPLANIGIRWHAVTFDPPLHFADNRTLHRVTPGALTWTAPAPDSPLRGGDNTSLFVWTSIPIPTEGTAVPEPNGENDHAPDASASAWLVLSLSFADEPRADPDVGTRSPAIARFAAAVWVDRAALHNPVTLYDTQATFAFHHDFGAAAEGLSASTDRPANATGIYLKRGPVHTTARILDESRAWADEDNVTGRHVPAVTAYGVPPYGRQPHASPSSLLSPVTLNVTVPMAATRANITSWTLPDGPTVGSGGNGVIVVGEIGFLADGPLTSDDDGNSTEPERRGPTRLLPSLTIGAGLVLVTTLALLSRASTDRTTRRR